MVALAQLEVADDSSSTYTTTTQLQRVTQGKDAVIGSSSLASYIRQGAVIGSSIVALVVLAQRGKFLCVKLLYCVCVCNVIVPLMVKDRESNMVGMYVCMYA